MNSAQREFDIVLYGATGFAGKLTAEYLSAPPAPPASHWPAGPRTSCSPSGRHWGRRPSHGP